MKEKLKKVPIAYAGLALGMAGITTAWKLLNTDFAFVSYIGSGLASVFLLMLVLKIILQFEVFKTEIKQAMLGSMFQTFFMAIAVISAAFVGFNYNVFKGLWIFTSFAMMLYLIFFIYLRLIQKDFNQILPSWFVPTVGPAIIAVTCAAMKNNYVADYTFYIALALLIILYPVMIYRFFFVSKIDDSITPVFAIFGAPPNITLAGYLTAFDSPNRALVFALAGLGLLSTFLVYLTLYRVKKINLKFSPIFAAFTFPLAIGTTSMIKVYNYLLNHQLATEYMHIWRGVIAIEIVVASIVIFYVFVNMIIFSYKNIFK